MTNKTINEFEAKLKAVDSRVNRQLFIFLGITLILIFVIDKLDIKSSKVNLGLIFLLVAYILNAIRTVITGKKKVAEEFGVVCSACGKTPKAFFMAQAMRKGKCPYCGGVINA